MRKTLVLLGLLITTLPAAAVAQPAAGGAQSIDNVRKEARVHVGPLYVSPTVLLKEFGVDTNVFNESGEPRADFTFTLTPKADVWVPFARRALITTTVGTDLVYYATYGSERSIDPQFTGRGEFYMRRITLFGENKYLNTRQRPNYEIDLRSRHLENDTAAGGDIRFTPKLSLEIAAIHGITRYDADDYFDGTSLQETLNRDTTGYRLVARHRVTPLTALALHYDSLSDRFPYSPERDADSFRIMPGVELKPRALINGAAYVGYRRFTPRSPGQLPEFSGLVSQLGLSYTLLGATTLGVSYRRDLTYSWEVEQPFFVNEVAGASVRRALGGRFDVLVSADHYRYTYSDLVAPDHLPAPAADPRVDTTWSYTGSLGYRIRNDGRIGVGVSYDDRQSTTETVRTYNGFRVGTVVSYGF